VFAPVSKNITTRFPEEIMEPNVGHASVSLGVMLKDGMNARSAIPATIKVSPQIVMLIPSGFVNKIVNTELN
jgi:hypothetical protein